MNWQNIQTKYPKAFTLYTEKYGLKYFLCRELYLFFDEQGIYGRVGKNQFMMFTWDLITDPEINICEFSDYDYNIRTEAEEALFLREFEILEEKL